MQTFLDFHKVGEDDNEMTYRGNPSNPKGDRRGDDPNRWCFVIGWNG